MSDIISTMSDNETTVCESANFVLDTDRLILEVEKRPALYNKKVKQYSDRNFKEKMWGEVCPSVINNWNGLSGLDKGIKGKEVKQKWKNLKDCFSRELAKQKQCTSGQAAQKRRKYIHFDSLLFLVPCMEDRQTIDNTSEPMEADEHNRERNYTETPQRFRHRKTSSKKPNSYESSLLEILEKKKKDEIDEDKSFALMLVPMLKKLDEEQKHFAKVEILNVMKHARQVHSTPNMASNIPLPVNTFPVHNVHQPGYRPDIPYSTQASQNQASSARMYYTQFSESVTSPSSASQSSSALFDLS